MKKTSLNAAYSIYINKVNKAIKKYGTDIEVLSRKEFKTAVNIRKEVAKNSNKHYQGNLRTAISIAQNTIFSKLTSKEAKAINKGLKNMGISDVPSASKLRVIGMPIELLDAIDFVKSQHKGLSTYALNQLIGQEIFGSL